MVANSELRILNILSGSNQGGAEKFFERLSIAFEKKKNIKQKIIMRRSENRYKILNKNIVDIYQVNFFNFLNPILHYQIKQIIKKFKPHIIMTWMNRASKILPSLKFVDELKIGRLGGYYKIKNYANCDYLVVNTPDIKRYVIEKGWDPLRVVCIPNFVETYNNKSNENQEDILLCMGRFHENKAFDIIIKAMPYLPNFKLWLVGDGKLEKFYKDLIFKLNLSSRVKIFSWTNEISEYLSKCKILICPSRHEPFGNIVVDGWSHKVPVIVSNNGGPNLFLRHKHNGMKFETDNMFDLVKQIHSVAKDSRLRKKIVNNAYKEYKKKFSEKIVVEKYINFFKRISK